MKMKLMTNVNPAKICKRTDLADINQAGKKKKKKKKYWACIKSST